MPSLSIGEAALAAEVSVDTVRYYDREHLLDEVARDAAGNRRFTDGDVAWLRVLRCLRGTGMSIADLRGFCGATGEGRARTRLDLLETHREAVVERIRRTWEQVEVIDAKIGAYRAIVGAGSEGVPAVTR